MNNDVTAAELDAVREAEAVPIHFPAHIPEELSQGRQDSVHYAGFCIWCGCGYERYSRELEAEHFCL
jgi:hypothetical protein